MTVLSRRSGSPSSARHAVRPAPRGTSRGAARLTFLAGILTLCGGLAAGATMAPAGAVTVAQKKPAVKKVVTRTTVAHHPSAALVAAVHRRQAAAARAKAAAARKKAALARKRAQAHAQAMARLVREAERHAGQPYSYGAAGPTAFDCSGFTRYIYGEFGVQLPHNAAAQYAVTQHIAASAAQPGDLLFLSGLGHVAIYVGHGMMVDATVPGSTVQIRQPYGPYLVGRVATRF